MTLHKHQQIHLQDDQSDYKLFTLPAEDRRLCFYAFKLTPSPEQRAATLFALSSV